jgi:hypothetical protein
VGEEASKLEKLSEAAEKELAALGSGVRSTVEQYDPVKKVQDFWEDLPDKPIVKGISGNDIADSYKTPEESRFDKWVKRITGFGTGDFSLGKLGNLLTDKLAGLWDLLKATLLQCIKNLLMKLQRKHPLLYALLHIDEVIGQFIGKYKRLVEDFLDSQTKNLLYRKLQIFQLEEFNKKITDWIRGLCNPGRKSSQLRDWQNDFSKAEYDVGVTMSSMIDELKDLAIESSSGYPSRAPDAYVNSDGTLKTTQQRLTDAQLELNSLLPYKSPMTLEENVAVKSLVIEVYNLKNRDIEDGVNC